MSPVVLNPVLTDRCVCGFGLLFSENESLGLAQLIHVSHHSGTQVIITFFSVFLLFLSSFLPFSYPIYYPIFINPTFICYFLLTTLS